MRATPAQSAVFSVATHSPWSSVGSSSRRISWIASTSGENDRSAPPGDSALTGASSGAMSIGSLGSAKREILASTARSSGAGEAP